MPDKEFLVDSFFFQYFRYIIPLSSGLQGSSEQSTDNPFEDFLCVIRCFFLAAFNILFFFVFHWFDYNVSQWGVSWVYPLGVYWSVKSPIELRKFSVVILSKSLSFFALPPQFDFELVMKFSVWLLCFFTSRIPVPFYNFSLLISFCLYSWPWITQIATVWVHCTWIFYSPVL